MINEWSNLFVATAGASAALTGLLFVGVSINLSKILQTAGLPERALISTMLLMIILVLSVQMLVPRQSFSVTGTRILIFGLVVWALVGIIDVRNIRAVKKEFKGHFIFNIVLDQIAMLAYVVSGIVIVRWGETGLQWLVSAIIFSFIKAVLDAWVLLVEINR